MSIDLVDSVDLAARHLAALGLDDIFLSDSLPTDDELIALTNATPNLVTLHAKTGIGRLSAYCGVVTAGAGAAAGIAFIKGGDFKTISHTIVNTLAISSGIVCDGAKASCAAKIAIAVESGLMGYEMYLEGNQFYSGEGLVLKGVENTIRNYGYLGRVAMHETNDEIIRMMINKIQNN